MSNTDVGSGGFTKSSVTETCWYWHRKKSMEKIEFKYRPKFLWQYRIGYR